MCALSVYAGGDYHLESRVGKTVVVQSRIFDFVLYLTKRAGRGVMMVTTKMAPNGELLMVWL